MPLILKRNLKLLGGFIGNGEPPPPPPLCTRLSSLIPLWVHVPTASTLEEKLLTQNPQLGRRTHHPRLDSFVHDVQKSPRERAYRAFMPMGRFGLSPQKDQKVFPKRPKKLGGARVPTHFHRFFQTCIKKTAESLFFPMVPDL